MVAKMQAKFNKYWSEIEDSTLLFAIGTVLDPRYKLMFVTYAFLELYSHEASLYITRITQALYDLFDAYSCQVVSSRTNERKTDLIKFTLNAIPVHIMNTKLAHPEAHHKELDQNSDELLVGAAKWQTDQVPPRRVDRTSHPHLQLQKYVELYGDHLPSIIISARGVPAGAAGAGGGGGDGVAAIREGEVRGKRRRGGGDERDGVAADDAEAGEGGGQRLSGAGRRVAATMAETGRGKRRDTRRRRDPV
ncbi:hypothetical protein Taro_037606 [Colocasia esculenta]|uniref:hAT-like transposase RNase-H fold domain-containing protein n=1 Tax=Colocasia esculenta TaxID=4460 RepID=A0A843W4K3_COLES|nr:hypothetical protein [Colocasia esculenta]